MYLIFLISELLANNSLSYDDHLRWIELSFIEKKSYWFPIILRKLHNSKSNCDLGRVYQSQRREPGVGNFKKVSLAIALKAPAA